jgi:Fe-S-cluster containining protein
MMLCEEDIYRLEKAGYYPKKFVHIDNHGYARLRNRKGYCFFYDAETHRCRAYKLRPLGCRVYPVIYSEEGGVIVDDLCPERRSVLRREVEAKGKKVMGLLKKIDLEAESRRKP